MLCVDFGKKFLPNVFSTQVLAKLKNSMPEAHRFTLWFSHTNFQNERGKLIGYAVSDHLIHAFFSKQNTFSAVWVVSNPETSREAVFNPLFMAPHCSGERTYHLPNWGLNSCVVIFHGRRYFNFSPPSYEGHFNYYFTDMDFLFYLFYFLFGLYSITGYTDDSVTPEPSYGVS